MQTQKENVFETIAKNPLFIHVITFSKPVTATQEIIRIRVRQTNAKSGIVFYCEQSTKTQIFHKNITPQNLIDYVLEQTPFFKHIHLKTDSEEITLLFGKKGNCTVMKKAVPARTNTTQNQNRTKSYLIPENIPVPFLVSLGVMNKSGNITKYDKFKQINRFIEFVNDILPFLTQNDTKNELSIVDYGCGKSYLTFAIDYFLTQKGIKSHIQGWDLKKEIIDQCNELAKNCNTNMQFFCGDISQIPAQKQPIDLAISLHACDTATDYALAHAVKNNARAILCVPCCQHEINHALNKNDVLPEFAPFLKYGIIKERFASLATDLMRSELLENAGYEVQLIEFIDGTHTAKNILLRAVKKTSGAKNKNHADLLKNALKIAPLLEKLL